MSPNTLATAMGIPLQRASLWAQPLSVTMLKFEITTPERIAAFIAQIGHESGGLSRLEEDFNYSAEGLVRTWPIRFFLPPDVPELLGIDGRVLAKDRSNALHYAHRPIAIGNRVYANRMGNGDEDSADGYVYRGRGPIMLTGKANYEACGNSIGRNILANPGLVLDPAVGALTVGWFWSTRKCNMFVDDDDFEGLTKAVNGGITGLVERQSRFNVALNALRSFGPSGDGSNIA